MDLTKSPQCEDPTRNKEPAVIDTTSHQPRLSVVGVSKGGQESRNINGSAADETGRPHETSRGDETVEPGTPEVLVVCPDLPPIDVMDQGEAAKEAPTFVGRAWFKTPPALVKSLAYRVGLGDYKDEQAVVREKAKALGLEKEEVGYRVFHPTDQPFPCRDRPDPCAEQLVKRCGAEKVLLIFVEWPSREDNVRRLTLVSIVLWRGANPELVYKAAGVGLSAIERLQAEGKEDRLQRASTISGLNVTMGCPCRPGGTGCCRCNLSAPDRAFKMKGPKGDRAYEHEARRKVAPLLAVLDELVAKVLPGHYAHIGTWTAPECRLPSTVFAAMTVNQDHVLAEHVDQWDLPWGVTVVAVADSGQEGGGYHVLTGLSTQLGGPVGIYLDLGAGAVVMEAAGTEPHATTAGSRVSVAFYSHKELHLRHHGSAQEITDQSDLADAHQALQEATLTSDRGKLNSAMSRMQGVMDTIKWQHHQDFPCAGPGYRVKMDWEEDDVDSHVIGVPATDTERIYTKKSREAKRTGEESGRPVPAGEPSGGNPSHNKNFLKRPRRKPGSMQEDAEDDPAQSAPSTTKKTRAGASKKRPKKKDHAACQMANLKKSLDIHPGTLTAAQRRACTSRPRLIAFMNLLMKLKEESREEGGIGDALPEPDHEVDALSVGQVSSQVESSLDCADEGLWRALNLGARKIRRASQDLRRLQAVVGRGLKIMRDELRRQCVGKTFLVKAREQTGYEATTINYLIQYGEMSLEAEWLHQYPAKLRHLTSQIQRAQVLALAEHEDLVFQMVEGVLEPEYVMEEGTF